MIQFDKPTNLNGAELIDELENAGIAVNDLPIVDGNGEFWLDIAPKDADEAAVIVAKHNGTIIPKEPTIADKLASVGLTIDDLKIALGL